MGQLHIKWEIVKIKSYYINLVNLNQDQDHIPENIQIKNIKNLIVILETNHTIQDHNLNKTTKGVENIIHHQEVKIAKVIL